MRIAPNAGPIRRWKRFERGMVQERVEVIDADLSEYFDSIPHGKLLRIVARRISDGAILKLIRGWLRAPIVEPKSRGDSGGGGTGINLRRTPQGGVMTPRTQWITSSF